MRLWGEDFKMFASLDLYSFALSINLQSSKAQVSESSRPTHPAVNVNIFRLFVDGHDLHKHLHSVPKG